MSILTNLSTAYGAGSILKPMPEQNFALQSQDLDTSWPTLRVEPVVDSGISAPEIDDVPSGNYWDIIPTAVDSAHPFYQGMDSLPDIGRVSFLYKSGGYGVEFFLYSATAGPTAIINSDGSVLSSTFDDISVIDEGFGDFFIEAPYAYASPDGVTFRPHNGATAIFAGNGTDRIRLTRIHVSEPNRRYVKTTDAPVP